MGNILGGNKTTKIMKIDGETLKLKTPVKAGEVLKNYQGYVLLESESVKHYGTRSKPLESDQSLEAKRLYFLVELPKVDAVNVPRKVRSGINMSAKDRLESLKLARRSASDLSLMRPSSMILEDSIDCQKDVLTERNENRVTMRVPKAVVVRLIQESKDEAEAAQKIRDLCMGKTCDIGGGTGGSDSGGGGTGDCDSGGEYKGKGQLQVHCRGGNGKVRGGYNKVREKRVSFLPTNEGGIQVAC